MIEKLSRFYLNKKTFLIAIIATLILEPVGMILLLSLGELIPFEVIAYGMLFFLLAGLFITHHKGDYILMNGIVSGILIYEFVRYAYLIAQFTGEDIPAYLHGAGAFIRFCFAFCFLAIAVVCLITYNHFTLNRSRAVNRTKIILNQFLLILSFFAPIVLIAMEAMLGDSVYEIVAYAIVGFSDAFLLLVVACCELELAINRRDEIALEELAMPDVRAALWYTVSGLFGLYALVMAVLLPDAGAFSYILSSIDLALSLGLLIYYLNKVKEPSPGYRTFLRAGKVATAGLTAFFIGQVILTAIG